MAEKRTTGKATSSVDDGKRMLQQMHDQGVIDLDAPMRQLFDKMETTGDVGGYQKMIEASEGEQWWALVRSTGAVLLGRGDGLKDDGLK